jgi:hypothetical protein
VPRGAPFAFGLLPVECDQLLRYLFGVGRPFLLACGCAYLATMSVAGSARNADIRPIIRQQGFYGPLNGREQIKYVGHIVQGSNDYRLYAYHGVFRAAAVDHGVNRLIVILNGSTFLGSYHISLPTDCKISGRRVICQTEDPSYPGVVEFTKRGPPYEIWFDGEVLSFEYGNKLKASWCNDHSCPHLDQYSHVKAGTK